MWTDLNGRKASELEKYGGVYIGGGNTFDLLRVFKQTGFDSKLSGYIDDGGIVYGSSAGAMVLGRHIGGAQFGGDPDENHAGFKDLAGLDKAYGYSISCHYLPEEEERIVAYARDNAMSMVALPENCGLYVNDRGVKVVGEAGAFLFDRTERRKLEAGFLLRE